MSPTGAVELDRGGGLYKLDHIWIGKEKLLHIKALIARFFMLTLG